MNSVSRVIGTTALALGLSACGGGGGSSSSAPPDPPAAVNTPPTISAVENQTVPQDASSGVVAFNVGDAESAGSMLAVTAESSNPQLLPVEDVQLAGNDGARELVLTPAPGMSGKATVTLVATDGEGASANQSFEVTVTSAQRSFREMVESARTQKPESDGESIVGVSWTDNPQDDETAFDYLFQ